ncbi:MAG: SDR family oxidoreductase [Verrucomicrobia bacterium]|nr:SDR family oxidoreductase [Verrucomicrobiota bacterium]
MNQLDLKGRNGIVTGGARGIGFAIAKRLLESGARVCLWDRDAAALAAAATSLGALGEVTTHTLDLTKPDACKAAARSTRDRFGSVELLVNNAGIAGVNKRVWEFAADEWRAVIETNLNAVFYVCNAVVPFMLERKYGRIVSTASIAGKEGNPNAAHYSAAKAGVIGLTKSLGKELAKEGILVNCITPAVIQTDILKQVEQYHIDYMLSKIPMGRFGKVEEAAALVAWLCSDDCSFTTGGVFDLSGGRATY